MTVWAWMSVRGAPGVTTTALAAAAVWPQERRARLIEADPAGGVLASRYSLSEQTGTASLAAAARRVSRPEIVDQHSQELPGGLPVVLAPTSASHAASSLAVLVRQLPRMLQDDEDTDTLIDCGRVFPGSPAWTLAKAADRVLLVTPPTAEALSTARYATAEWRTSIDPLQVVVVGSSPYGPREVAMFLGHPTTAIAHDPRAAAALSGNRSARSLPRSALVRSVRTLVHELHEDTSDLATVEWLPATPMEAT